MKRLHWLLLVVGLLLVVSFVGLVYGQESCIPPFDSPGNPYPCGFCTWWAFHQAREMSSSWGNSLQGLGDAGNWDNNVPEGIDTGTIPYVGAIAVFEAEVPGDECTTNYWRGCGHVAVVGDVQGTENHNFIVSEMNWGNGNFNRITEASLNTSPRRGTMPVSFIYPPSDRPVPLWPYHERRVKHQDPIILQWYGDFDFYGIWYNIYYDDVGHDGGVIVDLQEEQYPLRLPHPGVVTWLIWGYDASGGNEVQADLQAFYAGPCAEGETSGETTIAETRDYCSGEYNPTPIPTSTPFPTPTVPLNTPTIEPQTPTVVATWTPGPTNTPPSTPTVTEHTATVVPTWTPGPTDTPLSTPTPGGGIATPTTSVVTVTPVVCLPLEGDFDCNCAVDVTDIMAVVSRWRCQSGNGCYDGVHDLNDDGTINIVDIMIVVASWGESCGD